MTQPVPERRLSQQSMSLRVDIGVNYARTRGEPAARQYFASSGVPDEIAERALAAPSQRRRTYWERCPYEAAIRQALSVPPLLERTH
jgi:hypothetical protein